MDYSKIKVDTKKIINNIFVMLSLLFFSLPNTTIGVGYNQIIVHIVFLIILVYFSLPFMKNMFKTLISDKYLLVFLIYFSCTVMWSVSPVVSLIYVFKILTATFFSIYISTLYNTKQFFKYLLSFFILILVISYIFTPIFPAIFIHNDSIHLGSWRSIFSHKNALGTICVMGILISQIWMFRSEKKKIIPVSMFCLYVILLFLSTSRTAIVVSMMLSVILFILIFFIGIYKRNALLAISISSFMIILISGSVYLVIRNLDNLFLLMDRSSNLTGRTNIWEVVKNYIDSKLYQGYGAGGFWNSEFGLSASNTLNFIGLNSSHSGYYDLLIDIGLIGVFLFFLHYILLVRSTIIIMNKRKSVIYTFGFMYTLFILFNNYSDSRLLNTTSIYWVIYCCIAYLSQKEIVSKEE